jgi:hypothetical protein
MLTKEKQPKCVYKMLLKIFMHKIQLHTWAKRTGTKLTNLKKTYGQQKRTSREYEFITEAHAQLSVV